MLATFWCGLELQHMTKDMRPIAIDLFSGAGGFSFAAASCGVDIEFAIENDAHSASSYLDNIRKIEGGKNTKLYHRNILECNAERLNEEHFSDRGCDLILGGPPCQGFSTHRICDAGVNDPRNELLLAYFNFVRALRPRVFLLENVPGLLWGRHRKYLERFYAEGRASGYHLFQPVTLDARDFGVPQRRRRVFILGLRSDIPRQGFVWPPPVTHANPRLKIDDLASWIDCSEVFRAAPAGDVNDIHMQHGEALVKAFKNTPLNGGSRRDSGRVLPCHKEHDGHKDVYGRIDPSQPAPTMTTACINPSKGRFVHPTEHHGITVRQAARIQTFPDSFVFHGGLTAAGKQIGNAVPVELGKLLVRHLKPLLCGGEVEVDGGKSGAPAATVNEPEFA